MSKNVAVFVDVANIFYAAKAAGVDIDYVTLLKAATAGRDFVRAYAYTGLDPENENQRQFHAFLARSGYKVISKDIRKYGDGRVKANLDIELVVDMMKTARNLDIAVVVSGDGDFASAIRAVQEMGVRVEVISFRGNTSSDLIDVADLFTDIAQVARVDKGARSGRRVAAEGDLSMTEVPEKETEGAPRRRRGGRAAREERPAVEAEDRSGNIVAMPGERLSRAGAGEAEAVEDTEEAAQAVGDDGQEAVGEDGRRRRRLRGGRGRGRGRRTGEEELVGASEPAGFAEEDEDFEELPPPQIPHQTFGSVWDSQLGVPTTAMPPSVELSGADVDEDEDYAEPEVPEYLLAERRQRGRSSGSGGRGRQGGRGRSAYQAALDRERFGRSAQPSYGSSPSPNRSRDRGRQSRPQGGGRSQERAPRPTDRPVGEVSSEPWSEVPPELEEMLRAELDRKQPATSAAPAAVELTVADEVGVAAPAETDKAPAKRPTRSRTTKTAAAKPSSRTATRAKASADAAVEDAPAETDKAPAKRTTRSRTTKAAASKTSTKAKTAAETTAEAAGDEAAPTDEPKKPVRRRRTTAASATTEES